jgi:hypothetical protein
MAYRGPVERQKLGAGTAVTQVTEAAAHVTIAIPAGKGGSLVEVQVILKADIETVVCSGGHVEFRNSSTDWVPFEFFTPMETALTAGATCAKPYIWKCSKYLPGNSDVYVDFTPHDNQSQFLEVVLKWIMGPKPREETFSKTTPYANYKFASAASTTARTNWGTIAIPGGKGGELTAFQVFYEPTMENGIAPGGGAYCEWEIDDHDLLPMHMHTQVTQVLTTGAVFITPDLYPMRDICRANSNYTIYGTSNDDQAHVVGGTVCWKRPYAG